MPPDFDSHVETCKFELYMSHHFIMDHEELVTTSKDLKSFYSNYIAAFDNAKCELILLQIDGTFRLDDSNIIITCPTKLTRWVLSEKESNRNETILSSHVHFPDLYPTSIHNEASKWIELLERLNNTNDAMIKKLIQTYLSYHPLTN